jgi:hypothetical protein
MLVAVSIAETLLERLLVTYASFPSGAMATPTDGPVTTIVATTSLVAVAITATTYGLKDSFVTYTCFPSGVTATPMGLFSTGPVATTVLLAESITETLLEAKFVTYTCFPSGVTVTPRGHSLPGPWPPPCWWPCRSPRQIGVFPIRGNGYPKGFIHWRDCGHHRGVDHRDIVEAITRDVYVFPIRGNGYP